MNKIIIERIKESISAKKNSLNDSSLISNIEEAAKIIVKSYKSGGKLLIAGNGGSASDAMHMAGELVGRFIMERKPYSAYVLNSDTSTLTAISNDYGYEFAFSRQLEGHMNENDVFIGITTSGNSQNIIEALKISKGKTIVMTGNDGGESKKYSDITILVDSNNTARIQELHILIIHILCELIEIELK